MITTSLYQPYFFSPYVPRLYISQKNFQGLNHTCSFIENLRKKKFAKIFRKSSLRSKLLLLRLKSQNPLLALKLSALSKDFDASHPCPELLMSQPLISSVLSDISFLLILKNFFENFFENNHEKNKFTFQV